MNPLPSSVGERIREGDELALEECYRSCSGVVRSYVQRFVPASEAEDVVQLTFLELWRSRERYDPSRSLEAFVLGIARKRSIDVLRKRRHEVVDVSKLRQLVGDDGDRLVEQLAWAGEVRRALESLPAPQREAIALAYFEGCSQSEIASRLEVPLGTVKARMARGMKALGAIIGRGDVP